MLGLDQAVDWGWTDARVLAMFVAGVALLVGFVMIERRVGEAALIPPDVIANRGFRAACLTVLMLSAVFFSIVLYGPQLMEKVLGFSAAEGGVRDAADARPVRGRRLSHRAASTTASAAAR